MFTGIRLLKSQKGDHPGQPAQSRRLRDVILKARSQAGQPVFGRCETSERRGGNIASLVMRQLPDFSNQPIAVPLGHGNAAQESIWVFSFKGGQARYCGVDARDVRAALPKGISDDVSDPGLGINEEHPNAIQTLRPGPAIHRVIHRVTSPRSLEITARLSGR
jgi:hypothetical protein